MVKIKGLREKTEIELNLLLADKREALRKYRFEMMHGKTKNTKEARELRKDIARIHTLLKEKNKE